MKLLRCQPKAAAAIRTQPHHPPSLTHSSLSPTHSTLLRTSQPQDLEESVGPFLLSTEYAKDDPEVADLCVRLSSALSMAFGHGAFREEGGEGGREGGREGERRRQK